MAPKRLGHLSYSAMSTDQRPWSKDDTDWVESYGESFPHFCMACEQEFVPYDQTNLYCSELCLQRDEKVMPSASGHVVKWSDLPSDPITPSNHNPPRDIIPRASPSRPHSALFSPQAYQISAPPFGPDLSYDSMSSLQPSSPAASALRSSLHSYSDHDYYTTHDDSHWQPQPTGPSSPGPAASGFWPFSRSTPRPPLAVQTNSLSHYTALSSTIDSSYSTAPNQHNNTAASRAVPPQRSRAKRVPKAVEH